MAQGASGNGQAGKILRLVRAGEADQRARSEKPFTRPELTARLTAIEEQVSRGFEAMELRLREHINAELSRIEVELKRMLAGELAPALIRLRVMERLMVEDLGANQERVLSVTGDVVEELRRTLRETADQATPDGGAEDAGG